MNVFYLDASAWVKRYVQEPVSSWIHALFDARSRLATATLGYVETLAALCRRLPSEAQVRTESRLAADWQNMLSMELSFDVMEQAGELTR